MNVPEASVAQQVRDYVSARPVVRASLALGIVNHSALARAIVEEEGMGRHDAVLKALTRLQDTFDAQDSATDVQLALAESRLEVRTRVAMLTCPSSWQVLEALTRRAKSVVDDDERIHILHGWDALTAIAHEGVLEELRAALPAGEELDYREGLAELNVRTASPLDNVPGFLAEVATALARKDIALVDATTCRRDHIFLIAETDVPAAIEAIEALRP